MTARALQSTFLSLCWLAGALCQPVQCACAKMASHVGKHETSYRSEWFSQGSVYSFLTIRTVDLVFLNVSSLGNPLDITFYFIVQTLCQRSVNYLLFITSKGKEEEEEAKLINLSGLTFVITVPYNVGVSFSSFFHVSDNPELCGAPFIQTISPSCFTINCDLLES